MEETRLFNLFLQEIPVLLILFHEVDETTILGLRTLSWTHRRSTDSYKFDAVYGIPFLPLKNNIHDLLHLLLKLLH